MEAHFEVQEEQGDGGPNSIGKRVVKAKLLVGADGVWSQVRKLVVGDEPRDLSMITWNAIVRTDMIRLSSTLTLAIDRTLTGYQNSQSREQTSGSALFIKTKNHVCACPLLKHPYIHFIFAKIKQFIYKSHCFKIHFHTYTRVQKKYKNCI